MTRRVPANLPVRIVNEKGTVATGKAVEVSATGFARAAGHDAEAGAAVARLDHDARTRGPLEIIALVVRADADGAAVWFLDLPPVEAERLLALSQ